MNTIITIREKWDSLFFKNGIWRYMIRIIGTVLMFVTLHSYLELCPYKSMINPQLLMVLMIVISLLFYFNAGIAMFVYSICLVLCLSGISPILIILMAGLCWTVCGCSEINCIIAIITPVFVMQFENSSDPLLSVYLPFFIFSAGVYFARKTGDGAWRFGFPLYFTTAAFCFGLYGDLINYKANAFWIEGGFVDYNMALESFGSYAVPLVVMLFVNAVAAYLIYMLLSWKNIRFIGLQMDIREAIIWIIEIPLVIATMLIAAGTGGLSEGPDYLQIVLQLLAAFIVTRFFTSYKISAMLSEKRNQNKTVITEAGKTGSKAVSLSLREELTEIIRSHLDPVVFNDIISSDRTPVKAVLIFGENQMDKRYVMEIIEKEIKQKVIYLDAGDIIRKYSGRKAPELFDDVDENRFNIVFINNFDQLFKQESAGHITDTIHTYLDENVENQKLFFVMAADDVYALPEECFQKQRISRVIHADLDSGLVFNNTYVILRVIGQGGSGMVYKAYHKRLREVVVLKKLVGAFAESISGRNEVDTLKRIKHMYLPKVYDVFEKDRQLYTVMDFVSGESFEQKLQRGERFSQEDMLVWSRQLTDAVYYLHNMEPPIIHSDIKPGNIMLTDKGSICLIDFNISSMFDKDDLKAIGTTPGYSPMEQYGSEESYRKMLSHRIGVPVENNAGTGTELAGADHTELAGNDHTELAGTDNTELTGQAHTELTDNSATEMMTMQNTEVLPETAQSEGTTCASYFNAGLTERSDIYSIGATLYHMMAGERPAVDFSRIKPLRKYGLSYSQRFIDVVEKCMRPDPQERYESVVDLRRDLDRIPME